MNFLTVNKILKDEITKLNYNLTPVGFYGDPTKLRWVQDYLTQVIDDLGKQSSVAQKLNKVITSSEKLLKNESHILYLLKDPESHNGDGEVIGLLKIGQKKLYLHDSLGNSVEVEPMCILDFFVVPTKQRHGNGRKLFDYMLKDSGLNVKQLAIDGPSEKMRTFMKTNYGVEKLIMQMNNFAVAEDFFKEDPKEIRRTSGRNTPVMTAPRGRFSAQQPRSTVADIIHGDTSSSNSRASPTTPGSEDGGPARPSSLEVPPPTVEVPPPTVEIPPQPPRTPSPEHAPHVRMQTPTLSVRSSRSASPECRAAGLPTFPEHENRAFFDKYHHHKLW